MAEVRSILATDCGSTTTKAILIEKRGAEYRLINRGEAPTTVEAPFDDVTIGVLNATRELEDLTGRKFIRDGKILTPQVDDTHGVDLYLSTSSAGGGLQMMVMGVVRQMSAESAQRAALGAGAIIMDVIAIDDGRKDYQKIQRLRELRPDIVLLSGGTDGGTITHLVELGELLIAADPRPRFGTMNLPVIFAGNKDAREEIQHLLSERFDLRIVENLRPDLDRENLAPAREAIHELFLEHVMQQAPGYSKLMTWTSADIMSTPNAVGKIMVTIAEQRGINILGVDIGGATTDVFSVFSGNYTRTVSANLGMSYSICNVMLEAGIQNIRRWLPFQIEEYEVRNRLRNKMIRPTTIPQTYEDLLLEQAVSREALRLAFIHHKQLARGLKGVQQQRTIGEALEQTETGKTLVQMMALDMIIGSGGVLSHAPKRAQSALMMMDAYQPEGVTMLAVDSIFMMPQLGVLSTVHPEAAAQVFDRDCLVRLGSCIAPVGQGKEGEPCLTIEFNGKSETFRYGELRVLPLGVGETLQATLRPSRGFDVGAGKGKPIEATLEGGVVGVVVDTRGRPLQLPQDDNTRRQKLLDWMSALGLPKP
ncbi:MAG: glutamate mutase L [Fimbriimonadales bacterium]